MKLPQPLSVSLCLLLVLGSVASLAGNAAASYKQLHEDTQRLVKEGKLKEALPLALKAVELNPAEPAPHESLSAIYSGLGDHVNAVRESRRVVELRPRDELAHYNLALGLQQMGRHAEALVSYQRAVELGDRGLEPQLGEAQCLISLGRMTEAIRKLESMSKAFAQRKEVWLNLAHAYLLYEDPTGAILAADTALRLDPNYTRAIRLRAVIAMRGTKYRAALSLARRLIQLEPANPDGYKLAGKIAAQTAWSDVAEARWVLDQALKNVPASTDTFLLVGISCRKVAEKLRPRIYQLSPELKRQWWLLSERALRQAVKVSPDQLEPNLELAELLVERRMFQEALPYARRALKLQGQSTEAQAAYKKALQAENDLAGQFRFWLRSLVR